MKKGFTLTELLVTVAIVGVLASMGVSQFNEYRVRSRHVIANVMAKDLYTMTQTVIDDLVKSWTGSGFAQSYCHGGGAFVSIRNCVDLNHTSKNTIRSLTGGPNSRYYTDREYYTIVDLTAPPLAGRVSANHVSFNIAVAPCNGEIATTVSRDGVATQVHRANTFYWSHACNI